MICRKHFFAEDPLMPIFPEKVSICEREYVPINKSVVSPIPSSNSSRKQ